MKRLLTLLLGLGCIASASAQISLGKEGKGGYLSGSFDTNSIYYVDDNVLGDATEHWGSNTYLKLDYNYDRFSAGVQGDFFLPALQGYEIGQYNADGSPNDKRLQFLLSTLYVQWQDTNYGVRLGNIFDQFGNGLIYRSFEDRQLGLNNSLHGIHVRYNLGNYFSIKAMTGKPRIYDGYAGSWVSGADLSLSLSELFKVQRVNMNLEGSYVNRTEEVPAQFIPTGLEKKGLNMVSGRFNLDAGGFSLRSEYVHKGKDLSSFTMEQAKRGYAGLLELGYNYKTFSVMAQGRVLDNMGTMISLNGMGTGNTLNYLPALTRQYTYMLANLEPYQVNVEGEIGGQIDVYYSYRSKTDRRRYWNFHGNFSTFYTLHKEQAKSGNRELLWRDLNFDVERQWNKSLKTSLLYSYQEWSPSKGYQHRTYVANVFVADVTYKINRKHSIRVEGQYLLTNEYQGDWVAGLVEYNFAPRWSFFFQNMYNLEEQPAKQKPVDEFGNPLKVYYYNGGFSFTHKRTRVQLSYGRNRAGFVCSGGVCRYTPAYTGANIAITTSF